MTFERYAIYWLPDAGLGRLGAAWLGWDPRAGRSTGPGQSAAAQARKYGFHATIKAPFRLVEGMSPEELRTAARALCAACPAPPDFRLAVSCLHGFLALRPKPEGGLAALAARIVRELDSFRAAPSAAELDRRRAAGLSPAQEANLSRWGYPFVMEEFRPHLTLGDKSAGPDAEAAARAHFGTFLGTDMTVSALSLVGSDVEGRFHLIEDLPLGHQAGPASRADRA